MFITLDCVICMSMATTKEELPVLGVGHVESRGTAALAW
jgi:hypothetical protein